MRRTHFCDAHSRFARGQQCTVASFSCFDFCRHDREYCEQTISHELKDLTSVFDDRWNLTVEIAIKNIQQDP